MAKYDVLSLFDGFTSMEELKPSFKPLRLLSLFSGIGAFEKALDRITTPYELVAFCEIDEHAARSYCAIHGVAPSKNLGDITKVDEKALPKDLDVVTYGFPCQDISLAGNQKGLFNADGSKTRSGLFFDALRIIEETKPRVAIAENVKNLTGKKFREQFRIVLDSLTDAGYTNYYAVLNAKHFGVPQNRERVFIVSIRNDLDSGFFTFPKGFPLERRLCDLLEPEVDEKYYLSDKMVNYLLTVTEKNKARGNGNVYSPTDPNGISKTVTTKEGSRVKDNFIEEPTIHQVGQIYPNSGNPQAGRIHDPDGLCPTLRTPTGGDSMPKVIVREDDLIAGPVAVAMRGRLDEHGKNKQHIEVSNRDYANAITTVQKDSLIGEPVALDEQNGYIRKDGCVGTITTDGSSHKHNNRITEKYYVSEKGVKYIVSPKRGMCTDVNADVIQPLTAKGQGNWTGSFVSPDIDHLEKNTTIGSDEPTKIHLKNGDIITSNDDTSHLRVRKLTPKECFRLMGFDDADFAKAEAVNSDSQLYKQAGNSIVVDVLEHLFRKIIASGVFDGRA